MSIVPRDPHTALSPAMLAALREAYPSTARLGAALLVARHVDVCAALLRGEPVDPALLDRGQLERLRRRLLVRLDFSALDLLEIRDAA